MKARHLWWLVLLFTVPCFANVITNGNFDTGSTSLVTWSGNPTNSAATGWGMWGNNGPGTFTSQLVSSTLNPAAGNNMLHLATPGANDGIYQYFGPQSNTTFSVWIYVVSGTVGVGIGNDGSTTVSQFTTTTGSWQQLVGTASNTPVSEIIIYSSGAADFYVDNASVPSAPAPAPEPSSAVVLAIGALGVAGSLRRKLNR